MSLFEDDDNDEEKFWEKVEDGCEVQPTSKNKYKPENKSISMETNIDHAKIAEDLQEFEQFQ